MRLRGVGKRYDRRTWVLTGVDVDVPPGQRVAFRGGNGSGKSTLLRIMVGVTRPSAGRVEQRPREIGYAPDRFPPDERMSARSYLVHMGRIRGLGTRAATRRAEELLDRLRFSGGADSAMRALSKGNARKVVLAQALLRPPRLLVLDEPWSGLDGSAHGALGEILDDAAHAGAAVVFTEHDESVLRTHADRVHRVVDGHVVHDAVEPAPRHIRLVLRWPTSGAHPLDATEWLARDGIASARVDGDRVVLFVAEDHTDRLALSALRDGWSLVSACRADADEVASADGAR